MPASSGDEKQAHVRIRAAKTADLTAVLALYQRVATVPGGRARLAAEVDEPYVRGFLTSATADGLAYVAVSEDGAVVGEIHACSPGLFCFSHVLTDLTIAVDPEVQGRGIGRSLFETFMQDVVSERPDISRIELISRESNRYAIRFYESLGFVIEGEFVGRIRNVDGSLESDIPMAWTRI